MKNVIYSNAYFHMNFICFLKILIIKIRSDFLLAHQLRYEGR